MSEYNNIINNQKEIKSRIVFVKSKNDNNEDYTINAINYYICNLDNCKELKFINYFYINNNNEFEISDKIYCISHNNLDDLEDNSSYSLEIYSYELKLSYLKKFIDELKNKYFIEQTNKLGNKKYYFDEHHVCLPKNSDNSIKYSMAPYEMTFTMTQFNTNKSLKNVFGTHLNVVKERMDLFINNPDWYIRKGIPYTLGILLHGPPGTGKTSLIKAIAKDTNRHIFNIKLLPDSTKSQLNNLFFNDIVKVIKNGKIETYNIPLNERIYVMEDIDCGNDILLDREYKKKKEEDNEFKNISRDINNYNNSFEANYDNNYVNNNKLYNNNPNNYEFNDIEIEYNENQNIRRIPMPNFNMISQRNNINNNSSIIEEDDSEKITLGYILNLLDGILETPGRILIATSNYPDKLDKALIRPGRIDINLSVGYCTIIMIEEMYNYFFEFNKNTIKYVNFINQYKNIEIKNNITPAQLYKFLLDNFNNSEKAYNEILYFIENN